MNWSQMSEQISSGGESLQRYDDIVGRVHLQLGESDSEAVILVEGDSDRGALSRLVDRRYIISTGSRRKVFKTASSLLDIGDSRIICVYDRDFEEGPGTPINDSMLYPYPTADLESFILELGVAESAIESALAEGGLIKSGGPNGVVKRIKTLLQPVSTLRQLNARHGWGLNFSVSLSGFVDSAGQFDRGGYIKMLCAKARQVQSVDAIDENCLEQEMSRCLPPAEYRGRDFLQVFSGLVAKGHLKAKYGRSTSAGSLEYALEVAAPSIIETSDWGANLRVRWKNMHSEIGDD